MGTKTLRRGSAVKRSGRAAGGARPRALVPRSAQKAAAAGPKSIADRTLALWRSVSAGMKLRDLNLHIQGLYAELGKAVYEAAIRQGRPVRPAAAGSQELMARIGEMRRRISRLTAESEADNAGSRSKARKRT